MVTLKVTVVEGAEVVVLSSEAKAMLGVQAGDLLQLTQTAGGSLHLGVRVSGTGRGQGRSRVAETWRELGKLLRGLDRTKL
jgi:hypothetical protein